MDARACAALLLPVVKSLPLDAAGPYWPCPEAEFANLVEELDDGGIWREYLRRTKESSVGLRLEILQFMGPWSDAQKDARKHPPRRRAFLAAFLDDATIRDIAAAPGKFTGCHAGCMIPRLAVRDFAASLLASMWGMNECPDEYWTAAQWEELRRKVRERVAKEALPEL